MKNSEPEAQLVKRLDTLIFLQKQALAIGLYNNGLSKGEIGKNLHLKKATIIAMLKGIKKTKD